MSVSMSRAKMKTKVDVIIPVYNEPELVIRAIKSVPVREDVEIIVIDDCSTDDTMERVAQYFCEEDRGVLLVHQEENMGVGAAVNEGLDLSDGEYIVLLGADDYFTTDKFEQVMDELDGTDLVYFDLQINDGSLFKLTPETKYKYCGSTKFMRREFVGDTRNPEKRYREDWDFFQELMKKNPTEKFTHKVIKHYNYPREGSLTWQACRKEENGTRK